MQTSTIIYDKTLIIGFFRNREYRDELIRFAVPIALQQLIMSSLNMVSVIMIGQLGETAVASVGLANQIFFLMQLIHFGTYTGAAMFTAQFWGKGDLQNLRKVQSFALLIGLVVAFAFSGGAIVAPDFLLGIYTRDPGVISLGGSFLRIFGWSFPFAAISFCFANIMRSTGEVKTPMLVSTGALVFNAIFGYILIFGKFGFPVLGVIGAGIAGLVSRILETSVLLGIVYLQKMPTAIHLVDFSRLNFSYLSKVFKPILPVILNETFWSLGITTYYIIYARISTESLAAMNIVSSIENLALVVVQGISSATAIMIGNRIGAKQEQQAYNFAVSSLFTNIGLGISIGLLLTVFAPHILSLYKVSPIVIEYARKALYVLASMAWVRSANVLIVVGILRSGGDTRFSFFLDGMIIWILGVPLTFITAFIWKAPVYWVYFAVMSEELAKFILGTWRVFSKKWMHDMTMTV